MILTNLYRRYLDIFWLSSWSNIDMLNSFLIFSVGISFFQFPSTVINFKVSFLYLLVGLFSFILIPWYKKPKISIILLMRMLFCFCFWLLFFLELINRCQYSQNYFLFILSIFSSWCVFRTNSEISSKCTHTLNKN